jgi:3-deoxy-7-phosphoheptulonate synthase
VEAACQEAARAGLAQRLMIDASHANAAKRAENQIAVCQDIAAQVARGDARIVGVMVESHLVAGRQDLAPGRPLVYGQSITDPCLGWEDSAGVLETLSAAARERRLEASRRDEAEGER